MSSVNTSWNDFSAKISDAHSRIANRLISFFFLPRIRFNPIPILTGQFYYFP